MIVHVLLAGVDRQKVPDCEANMLEGALQLPRMMLWGNQEEGQLFTSKAIHRGLDCPPRWKLPVSQPASVSGGTQAPAMSMQKEVVPVPTALSRSCLSTETHLKAEMIEKCRRHVTLEIHAPSPWHPGILDTKERDSVDISPLADADLPSLFQGHHSHLPPYTHPLKQTMFPFNFQVRSRPRIQAPVQN